MKLKRLFVMVIYLAAAALSSLAAHTILIDTSTPQEFGDLESENLVMVVSAESGLMDALFDSGHIFFNMYTVVGDGDSQPDASESLNFGTDIGADYLIMLDPRDEGLYWYLYSTEERLSVADGSRGIGEVDSDLPVIEKWTALGQLIADDIISLL